MLNVVAPRGKHQQGFGHGVHGVVQHDMPDFFGQVGAAGLTRGQHLPPNSFKSLSQRLNVGGLARPVYPLKAYKQPGAGGCGF